MSLKQRSHRHPFFFCRISIFLGLFATATMVAGASATLAGSPRAAAQDCQTQRSQTAMNACEEEIYHTLTQSMAHDLALIAGPFNRSDVGKAQSAWLRYLQLDCATVFNFYYPGTAAPYEKARCEVELSRDRITELQPLIHPEEYS